MEQQLDRMPRGRWRVVASCHLGVPTVIESHPVLEDGSPFPTLYWLTCPVLNKRASSLEASRWMDRINQLLATNQSLRRRLSDAIDRYRRRRDSHAVIDDKGVHPGGGPDRVKCIHAHLAHELSGGNNPVGALAFADAGWPDCREACYSVEETP